jgi:hypothetical protein
MQAVLKAMLREEWRLHSLVFGNGNFSFFPAVLAVFAFVACLFTPLYASFLDREQMASILHLIYLFFGLSVGSFGLVGREALNRRLGDMSLIAYSSRTLPVSERRIFADFVLKDTLFYMLFLIVPFFAGYLPSRMLLGLPVSSAPALAISLTLSFLIGLSASFILSTAYAHWGKPFIAASGAAAFAWTLYDPLWLTLPRLASALPPLNYYLSPSWDSLAQSVLLATVPSALSILFVAINYHLTVKRYPDQYTPLAKRIGFGVYSRFIAKDLLDLNRSEGGLGKIIMSFAFPLAAVAVMVSFFSGFLPVENYHFMLVIALMCGLISTSLYSWLAEYDFMEQYEFLPITESYVIKSKLIIYSVTTAIVSSFALLLAYAWLMPPPQYLILSFLLAASTAAYTTAVTVYLCGLRPNVMLYSGKVFILYMSSILPPALAAAIAFMTGRTGPLASAAVVLALSAFMLPLAFILLKRGYAKWGAAY